LKGTPGIGVTHFAAKDVVRHPLVQRIIEAYDSFEAEQEAAERARKEAREQERETLRQERQERLSQERLSHERGES
ncbi:MAG TPA: PhoH family protein, partial [Halomonas sp.]|nr:PhoH family protein [Halomonas sp.]